MEENVFAGGAVADAGRAFFDRPENERGSVQSTARRQLHFLAYPAIQSMLREEGKPSIDLKALKTKPTTIYLCLPATYMGICARWFRLLINATLGAMEEEKTRPPYPVLMCLDEFPILGYMRSIEQAAGQLAGLSTKLHIVIQDIS